MGHQAVINEEALIELINWHKRYFGEPPTGLTVPLEVWRSLHDNLKGKYYVVKGGANTQYYSLVFMGVPIFPDGDTIEILLPRKQPAGY